MATAQASPSPNGPVGAHGCSQAVHTNSVGAATSVTITFALPVNCDVNNYYVQGAGGGVPIYCQQSTNTGGTQPTSLTVRFPIDNTGFGSNTPASVRTVNANACIGQTSGILLTTVYCTSDGTITGSPRYGILRVHVEMSASGGVDNFDINSDGLAYTIIECTTGVTTFQRSGTVTPLIGGDTVGVTYRANSTSYDAATVGHPYVACGAGNVTLTNTNPDTSSNTQTTILKGPPSMWPQTCSSVRGYVITRYSALSTYSSVPWTRFTGTLPAGAAVDASQLNLYTTTSVPVERTLTATAACSLTGPGTGVVLNRNETVTITNCDWVNARGAYVTNNYYARAWIERAGHYRDATDFSRADGQFSGHGDITSIHKSATNANVSSSLGYHKQIDSFGPDATRSDANLYNWGNTTGLLDVNSTLLIGGVDNSKTPYGQNVSLFTIGVDTEYVRVHGVTDQSHTALSGVNVTCTRTNPGGTREAPVDVGVTATNGSTTPHAFTVIPPVGTWQAGCTATWAGNSGTINMSYQFTSPFTANVIIPVHIDVKPLPNGSYAVNVSAHVNEYSTSCDCIIQAYPDSLPRVLISHYNASTGLQEDLDPPGFRHMTNTDGAISTDYYFVTILHAWQMQDYVEAQVALNLTGSPFIGVATYGLPVGGFNIFSTAMYGTPYVLLFAFVIGLFIAGVKMRQFVFPIVGSLFALGGFLLLLRDNVGAFGLILEPVFVIMSLWGMFSALAVARY